jgi:murein DD-endopeptidase MepM/ murein hydrolase activator NlpD
MHHRRRTPGRFPNARNNRAVVLLESLVSSAVTSLSSAAAAIGGRQTAALAAAGVLTVGLVVGTATLVEHDPQLDPAAATISAEARERAAERADRSGRVTTAGPGASALAAPSTKTKAKTAPATKKPPAWVLPISGAALTSCYGARWGTMHLGIDLAAPYGTKIVSVGAGTVVQAGWLYGGYGISVVVNHGNGYLTHYAHASKVLVRAGQKVKAGTPLALEGSTGDSTGPHLHFEVHKAALWQQIEPSAWLRARGVRVGC